MIPTFVLTFVYENSTFLSGTLIITLATANSVYSSRVHCIDAHYNGVHSNDANASDAHSNEAQANDCILPMHKLIVYILTLCIPISVHSNVKL